MIDPVLEAYAEYERTVAPAYELIRRARSRLLARVAELHDDPVPAAAAFVRHAVPDEPNGADYAVEAALERNDTSQEGEAVARTASPTTTPEAPDKAVPTATDRASVASPPGDTPDPAPTEATAGLSDAKPDTTASERSSVRVEPAPDASAPELVACPDCGDRVKARGLGVHRRHRHGHRAGAEASPAPEPEPVDTVSAWTPKPEGVTPDSIIKGGKERWLCNRCTAFFNSAEGRDKHQATHSPIPEGKPVNGRAFRGPVDQVLHGGRS